MLTSLRANIGRTFQKASLYTVSNPRIQNQTLKDTGFIHFENFDTENKKLIQKFFSKTWSALYANLPPSSPNETTFEANIIQEFSSRYPKLLKKVTRELKKSTDQLLGSDTDKSVIVPYGILFRGYKKPLTEPFFHMDNLGPDISHIILVTEDMPTSCIPIKHKKDFIASKYSPKMHFKKDSLSLNEITQNTHDDEPKPRVSVLQLDTIHTIPPITQKRTWSDLLGYYKAADYNTILGSQFQPEKYPLNMPYTRVLGVFFMSENSLESTKDSF